MKELQHMLHNRPFFYDFITNGLTNAQYQTMLKMSDDDALYYLLCAYGCHVLSHQLGRNNLITNPDKLFGTQDEIQTFIDLFKRFARDELATAQAMKEIKKAMHNSYMHDLGL